VRYAKSDLIVPADDFGDDLAAGNAAAVAWCAEVNAAVHSEIAAVPDERLVAERDVLRALPSLRPTLRLGKSRKVDKLSTVRIGSVRYSVPHQLRGIRAAGQRAGAAERRPHRGAAPAQARHGAAPGPRGPADSQGPALGPRGGATHPHRGRGRRPRRVQPTQPTARGRVPGRQDPGRVQGRRVLGAPGHV
jgi:hypothetical protein